MLSFKLCSMYEALIVGNYIKLGYVTKAIDIVSYLTMNGAVMFGFLPF